MTKLKKKTQSKLEGEKQQHEFNKNKKLGTKSIAELFRKFRKIKVNPLSRSSYKDDIDNFRQAQYRSKPDLRYYGHFVHFSKYSYNTYQIRFATNNIFCHVYNNIGQTMHPAKCFGDYKIKISKKNKNRRVKELMQLYSDEIISRKHRQKTISPFMIFKLAVKKRLRYRILRWLKGMVIKKVLGSNKQYNKKKEIKSDKLKRMFMFDFGPQKAFNGCRGKIVRRKKRLYRYFRKRNL